MLTLTSVISHCDILWFSRGRGRGHAGPDAALISGLQEADPELRVTPVSYGSGSKALQSLLGGGVIDLGLEDSATMLDIIPRAGRVLDDNRAYLVVAHEEPVILPLAKVWGVPTLYLTHWFAQGSYNFSKPLTNADNILFLEQPGLFAEPAEAANKVTYVGPVTRNLALTIADRESARQRLGIASHEKLVLVLPGSWPESQTPLWNLITGAFSLLEGERYLYWLAGDDYHDLKKRAVLVGNVEVRGWEDDIETLMVACDVAITKGSYSTHIELRSLGIPHLVLSHGANYIDDLIVRHGTTGSFLWAKDTSVERCAEAIQSHISNSHNVRAREARLRSNTQSAIKFISRCLTDARFSTQPYNRIRDPLG